VINRIVCAGAAALICAFPAAAQTQSGTAQTDRSQAATSQTGTAALDWTFSLTPYVWLPNVDSEFRYQRPNGVTVGANPSIHVLDNIDKIRFGATVEGEVRYDRFFALTDILYLSMGGGKGRLGSVDVLGKADSSVSNLRNYGASASLQTTIWSLGGGYTLFEGAWGNVDALAGFRLLVVDSTTNYGISALVTGPAGNTVPVLGVSGSLSATKDVWNGIGGVRGRIALGESRFYLPFYFDVGAGDSKFTWQTNVGVGYRTDFADISLGYRYMNFQQYNSAVVRKLSLSGAMEATFHC
jgi:hypothetical protein